MDRDWYQKESEMAFHSFICGNITPGDARNTDLLVRFDWMWFCFNVCWPGKQDGMVCMAKVSRSNTSFQKVKYHSLVYNSSTMIRTNIFYFQKTCYMLELTCPSGSYDQENYLYVYSSLLKHPCSLTFPTFQYLQLTNNILCIFLNVTARPASGLQRKHT